MNRKDIIERLLELGEDKQELRKMKKDELEELLEEYTDESTMYPNGRDYDAEDY
ncbi:hypothetical protein [Clostridium guangxiense]|uniref:hypothetical protein n=1 Tax=Clostridium guangxiense TaxID=1662055 RepID=UPI001E283BFA|nr:hypothetical protein [Clostridium guangxiense]MCD2347399.1 hypothetical protein [Clostridium guangxiense]